MSYISGVLNRLTGLILFFVFGFLILWFPGGAIIMGTACHATGKLDGWDWIFSIFVPFYGVIEAMFC